MKEYEYLQKAMGTDFSISIITDSKELADSLAQNALSRVSEYEKKFSRFIEDSELSILNSTKEMVVSDIFLEATQEAYELYKITEGNFNPLVQIARLGYTKTFNEMSSVDKFKSNEEYSIDFSKTIIDPITCKIILQSGQKLDFGGFLKGYLAEKICKEIVNSSSRILGVIVNIGGDIHTQGVDEHKQKFVFNIYNPVTKKDDINIELYNQSLATSGTYKRTWKNGEKTVHHILDSRGIQNPETDIVSISIIHNEGKKADAFTKVFLSVEITKAKEILKNEQFSFILITKDGNIIKNN